MSVTSQQGSGSVVRPSARATRLAGEGALDVLAAARRLEAGGTDVVHLEIGEPGIPTPGHIVEAGVRALREGHTRYGPPQGLPELRAAVADSLASRGVRATPDEVVITPGAKPMITFALLAVLEPGDEVLVPDPGFPIYASVARFADARPVAYPLDRPGGFQLSPDAIAERISARTRVLVLNLPHNPTGGAAEEAALDRVAALALRHDLVVITDEVYSRLRYDGAATSIAARPGLRARTVLVDGFSKAYAMTGWRLGYGVLPPALADRVTALIINSTTCTPAFVQLAGLVALTGPQDPVDAFVTALRARRDRLVRGLNAIPGISCPLPPGAFYAFPDVRPVLARAGLDTDAFAARLLSRYGVAALSGTAFGPGGDGHLRLSFAAPADAVERALERLERCVSELPSA
ncbi:MAG TPA: pyridoxal phosphate-dependent aminotransferase [Gemmatimonadales bacterium]|nr:pyridoxal phosphate-dependent aminotransferase [Gemmatimonadales bacterium]